MALLGTIVKAALVLLGVLLLVAGLAYASDYAVGGTVDRKGQNSETGDHYIDLGMDLGFDHRQVLSELAWNCIQEGNYVKFHVRSERTLVYESKGGSLLYDSAKPTTLPAACTQGGGGGGGNGFPFLLLQGTETGNRIV